MSKFSSYTISVSPGCDVIKCLQDFSENQNFHAAFVMQCVGKICRATLRLANTKIAFNPVKEIGDEAKIESLVGTISGNDGHLHVSLSSKNGEMIGGHVFGPLVAFGSVEVVIGECEDFSFTRSHDQHTGYPELVVINRDSANLETESQRPIFEGSFVLNQSGQTQVVKQSDSKIKVHAVRLVPGEDIYDGIKNFVTKNELEAPFILTCVGSVTKAVLELNHNETKMITMEGHYEIVSLVGTPTNLTISLADERGHVTTGHVIDQLIIFTTAELVIGERISVD